MKKLTLLAALCLTLSSFAYGQQVTKFPPASLPLSGAESLYIVQGGHGRETQVGNIPSVSGTPTNPSTGWFKGIGISDTLTHYATVTLEFPSFAAFAAYKPSVFTTALAWAGAPVVAHTAGYYTAGDGGSATYVWNSSSGTTADGLYVITPGGGSSGRWLLQESPGGASVKQLGVHVDGVTPDDGLLKAALAACTLRGTSLNVPAGNVLLSGSGSVTSLIQNCALQGAGQGFGFSGFANNGTTVLLTSTSVQPFLCGRDWSVMGFNFYWPNQTTGTPYPPLMTDTVSNGCNNAKFMNNVVINAYDGFTQSAGGPSWGDITTSGNTLYAIHRLWTLNNVGDSIISVGDHYDGSAWGNICPSACNVAKTFGVNNAVLLYASAVPVNGVGTFMTITGSIAFGWRYGIFVADGGAVVNGLFDLAWDGIGTLIDASSGTATYTYGNKFTGSMTVCGTVTSGAPTGTEPCFNMGAHSDLFLTDFVVSGGVGSFVESAGSNISLNNVRVGAIGLSLSGGEYYGLHQTANTGGSEIVVQNSRFQGIPGNIHMHGITAAGQASATVQNNRFLYFNDAVTLVAGGVVVVQGNSSQSTVTANGSFALSGGSGAIQYDGNLWDQPPRASVTANGGCGSGATVTGAIKGAILTGTGTVTTCHLTLPWLPHGTIAAGGCRFTFGSSIALGGTASSNPPIWAIIGPGGSTDLSSALIYYDCTGDQ